MVMFDFLQHRPVQDTALFINQPAPSPQQSAGRDLWLRFIDVCILTQQHRFSSATEDGAKLCDVTNLLMSESEVSQAQAAKFCDALNTRAVATDQLPALLACAPRAIVLRHEVRRILNPQLCAHHAQKLNKRMLSWRSIDTGARFRQLSPAVLAALENLPSNKTGDMPTMQYFFPGILYACTETLPGRTALRLVKNNTCVGVRLLLHPAEGPDPGTGPCWQLKHHPMAIYVRPEGLPNLPICSSDHLIGCVPLLPKPTTKPIMLIFPQPQLVHASSATLAYKVNVHRRGFPLNIAYAVTDFFSQVISSS